METLLLLIAGLVYFLPAIIALGRKHHNAGAIGVLNILLGWTLLGWVVALVWASTEVHQPAASPTLTSFDKGD